MSITQSLGEKDVLQVAQQIKQINDQLVRHVLKTSAIEERDHGRQRRQEEQEKKAETERRQAESKDPGKA